MRVPNHIGVIPDGNRRWSVDNGLSKDKGYTFGLDPGLSLYKICKDIGVKEITYYGFTTDNTKRPSLQREAFVKACVDAVKLLSTQDADLLVVGNAIKEQAIQHTTIIKSSKALLNGVNKIQRAGMDGMKEVTTEVISINNNNDLKSRISAYSKVRKKPFEFSNGFF